MRLRTDDRKAVDLALDRSTARQGAPAIYAAADGALRERVAGVETLLHILDCWNADEPPRDLLERTLERVSGPSGRRHRAAHPIMASADHRLA